MLSSAQDHFNVVDDTMSHLLEQALAADELIKAPEAKDPNEYFEILAASIGSQQISIKAADAIWSRVTILLGKVAPHNLQKANDTDLRTAGLSRQKITYLRSLAEFAEQEPSFLQLHELENAEVINELTKVKGIGVWTAEMFLMFGLARPDVFSYGDLGLMRALETHYDIHYKDVSAAKNIIEPLSPYRTVAALTLWTSQ